MKIFFSIPLAAKSDNLGWEIRSYLLGQTLRSVLNQTDTDFRVLVAGHEKPEIDEMYDDRVKFIRCTFGKPQKHPEFGLDMRRKRIANAFHVSSQGGGYIVFLDADDLVSKYLVSYMRRKADPNGYIFNRGYVLDYCSKIIAPSQAVWKSNLSQACGSCAAVNFSQEDIGSNGLEARRGYYCKFVHHAKWEEVAAREGRPLYPIPFPAVVYVLNTYQSLSATRQQGEQNLRSNLQKIHKHKVPLSAELAEEFSIDAVVPPIFQAFW